LLAESIVESLNPEQREAVTHTEGPLLVLAGAGSGKTRVLVHRVAWLIGACGIPPEGILAVTFTNKAAGEMRERAEKLLGPEAEGVWCSTFHSTCVRILRRECVHLNLSRGFAIYDDDDSLQAIKEALRRHELDPKVHDPRRIRWRIDQFKNLGILPAKAAEAAGDLDEELTAELYATYQKILAENEALDFGDLLLQVTVLFKEHPDVLEQYRRRWQYVMVDEYQDTNRVQYDLITQLAGQHQNLCVVGDPDQSIYKWRGADVRNILDFERDFANATTVRLERNYRSTQPILDGATAVVSHNVERLDKKLYTDREEGEKIRLYTAMDDRDEAQFVVREIIEEVRKSGRPYRDAAIFYRTNAQSRTFEEEFLKYDVPYNVVGGVRFYARAEVKDALAYLRLAMNPQDSVAVRRVVNNPARGIGKATVERAAQIAHLEEGSILDGLRGVAQEGGRAGAKVATFIALADQLAREVPSKEPAEAIAYALDRSGYLRHLEQQGTTESEARVENLKELLAGADDFTSANAALGDDDRSRLELFLEEVALVADIDRHDTRADRVSLMTVHSAKGLEFPLVFLVGLEEGIFPHSGSSRDPAGLEEERRLCYVGMTRAMERLVITSAEERRRFGSRSYQVPSRFLSEIPQDLVQGEIPGGARASSRSGGDYGIDYSYAQDEPGESGGGLAAGLRVRHPIFGEGTVMQVSGAGQGQKLRIRFDKVGVKTVLLRFANLEVV
jgi:DNA helicase-2/ATP-dependent DNA helicase PcrA